MNDVLNILKELRATNSTNEKLAILKANKENIGLQKILSMTYDTVKFNYYITPKTLLVEDIENPKGIFALSDILDRFNTALVTREVTGNSARDLIQGLLNTADSKETADTALMVLNRDLRINIGRTLINKIWPDLITKPRYMRCSTYNDKTAKKISYPAMVQLKADGTYREFTVQNGQVTCRSRSGEEYSYPKLEKVYSNMPDGVYVGELLVLGIANRAEANGLLNSDNPPHAFIFHYVWDYISLEEYSSGKGVTPYKERFEKLYSIVRDINELSIKSHISCSNDIADKHSNNLGFNNYVKVIESHVVNSLEEAVEHTVRWMNQGLEGSILKDFSNTFKDGTSPTLLKLKVEADAEVYCTGFTDGTKGTKREATFGAMTFESADGKVVGQTSGFTDAQLSDFNSRQEELIGRVFTVKFNDITKARDSDTYALSHPSFVCFRDDKFEADTFEKMLEIVESAKQFKDRR